MSEISSAVPRRRGVARGDGLLALAGEGVAPWLDGLHRGLLRSGELARLARHGGGLLGAVAAPEVLAERLPQEPAYRPQLDRLTELHVSAEGALWAVAVQDLRLACDAFAEVHAATLGHEGLVAAELDPRLTDDPARATAEARELAHWVGRPNLLVTIPATAPGLTAIRDCLALGIGVRAVGIFSVGRYLEVVDAWLTGLEAARTASLRLGAIPSVAAVPIGRIDAAFDHALRLRGDATGVRLTGTAGTATARLIHAAFEERLLTSRRWHRLRAAGARPQRLEWAQAGRAAERLVTWGTVQTLPPPLLSATADSFRSTGDTLRNHRAEASAALAALARHGAVPTGTTGALEAAWSADRVAAWRRLLTTVSTLLTPSASAVAG